MEPPCFINYNLNKMFDMDKVIKLIYLLYLVNMMFVWKTNFSLVIELIG